MHYLMKILLFILKFYLFLTDWIPNCYKELKLTQKEVQEWNLKPQYIQIHPKIKIRQAMPNFNSI